MNRIQSELDYLVARFEAETDAARKLLDEARDANDYYKEKVAAKFVSFCEAQEKAVRLFVEAKLDFPEIADVMERQWPHYRSLVDDARQKFAELDPDAK